jgi:oleate hydratase
MKAHIVGGGFGGLAAAGYLIRNAGVSAEDITIYEADERMGGGFFLDGSAESGYNLPGSVFDNQFRCSFELLDAVPSLSNPAISVKEEFFTFNTRHPFDDRARLIDRNGHIVHGPRFGLSWRDGFDLARLALTPEAKLGGRRIEEFFSARFFKSEFCAIRQSWVRCRSWRDGVTALPESHPAHVPIHLGHGEHLAHTVRSVRHVHCTARRLAAWTWVNLQTGVFVGTRFAVTGRITVDLDYEQDSATNSVTVAADDLVLVTFGCAADMSAGSMTEAPRPQHAGRSWRCGNA